MSSQVRERVTRVGIGRAKVSRIPFGLNSGELVAAVLVALFFLVVVVYYFTSLKPEIDRLAELEVRLASQQDALLGNRMPGGDEVAAPDTSQQALESLETFKYGHLRPLAQGRIALINEVNALAKKTGVRLTSGIDMRMQSVSQDKGEKSSSKSGNAKQSLEQFPRLEIHFTVFGQYMNLREFISSLEQNKQFLVIDGINLNTVDEEQVGRGQRAAAAGSGVALSINMSAYFQP